MCAIFFRSIHESAHRRSNQVLRDMLMIQCTFAATALVRKKDGTHHQVLIVMILTSSFYVNALTHLLCIYIFGLKK